jgi:hypothetical protein
MTRLLPEIQRGFGYFNRYLAVPLHRAGFGRFLSTPLTGSQMVLRTRGRTSGLWREAPLGYLVLDGYVYCCAGFGQRTQWLRNIKADPHVELLLPTVAVAGIAEEVTDPAEWNRGMRALLVSFGVIGRSIIGDVHGASDERLEALAGGLPLVRIRVTGLGVGPYDPGGLGWIAPTVLSGLGCLALARWLRSARRRAR